MLSPEQRSWFDAHLRPSPHLSWYFARKTIIKEYGINDAERQAQRSQESVNLGMSRDESVDRYTDRYHKIRREAGWDDNRTCAALYINSLLLELAQHVWLAQVNLPTEQRRTVDQAASIARPLDDKVVLSKHSQEVQAQGITSNKNGKALLDERKNTHTGSPVKVMRCRLHGKGRHDTGGCRVLSEIVSKAKGKVSKKQDNGSNARKKRCYKCGEIWTLGHQCQNKKKPTMALRAAAVAQEPAINSGNTETTTPPSPTINTDVDTDMVDEVNSAFYDACTMCKSTHIKDYCPSQDTHTSYVPITIQERPLWAFADTGATLSALTPSACNRLSLTIIPCKGKITLASAGVSVDRLGTTGKNKD